MLQLLAAQAGMAAFGGWVSGSASAGIARANNRLSAARAEASNKVRDAGNAFNLARFEQAVQLQAIGNRRRTEDLGDALAAAETNYARQKDLLTRGSFEDSIREAEEAGRQAAEAAAFGIGGDAVDVISGTTALRTARAQEDAARANTQMEWDFRAAKGNMILQAMTGLDNSSILADVDYAIDVGRQEYVANPWKQAIVAGLTNGGGQALTMAGTDAWKKYAMKPPKASYSNEGRNYRFGFQAEMGPRI